MMETIKEASTFVPERGGGDVQKVWVGEIDRLRLYFFNRKALPYGSVVGKREEGKDDIQISGLGN